MSIFTIIMLAIAGFFAYQVYRHIQTLEDKKETSTAMPVESSKPQNEDASFALIGEADEAYEEGDLERAQDKLVRANQVSKNNPEILNKLGFVEGKLGHFDEAIKHYEQSLSLDDNDDLAHNALASIYKDKGEFAQAQEHYEEALNIDSQYAVTYYNYGNLLVVMGETAKAKEMYVKALSLDGELQAARTALEELA